MEPLIEAVEDYLEKYFAELGVLGGVKVNKVKGVRLEVNDLPKETIAYSGNVFEINPIGWVGIVEELYNGSRTETMEFYVKVKCKFCTEKEGFMVTDVNNLVAFREK